MAFYELIYIVRPDVSTQQVDALTEKYSTMITENGGKVKSVEQWGLRTLAYKIRKHRKGYYTMLCVEMNGETVNQLEHSMKLSDDVIRFMTVKVDELDEGPSIMMRKRKEDYADSSNA